jgi:hypothetical protein
MQELSHVSVSCVWAMPVPVGAVTTPESFGAGLCMVLVQATDEFSVAVIPLDSVSAFTPSAHVYLAVLTERRSVRKPKRRVRAEDLATNPHVLHNTPIAAKYHLA